MSEPARSVTERNRAKQSFGRYTYPSTPGTHNIVLHFRDYSYEGTDGNVSARAGADSVASVVLPIPSNIEDSYGIQINQFELGAGGALAADALTGNLNNVMSDLGGLLSNTGEGLSASGALSTIKAAGAFAGRNALDALGIGGLSAAVDVTSGTAVNPHVALRFEGVNLKNHEFTWTLSPKNEDEARTIRDMINFIRSKILPTYNTSQDGQSAVSRALLNYPSVVDIYFVGADQSYLYYFKPAMVSNFKTNYSPNGLAFNRGGKPAVIQMSMSLTEARIHTASDVNQG